jgi:hypothetical protein
MRIRGGTAPYPNDLDSGAETAAIDVILSSGADGDQKAGFESTYHPYWTVGRAGASE